MTLKDRVDAVQAERGCQQSLFTIVYSILDMYARYLHVLVCLWNDGSHIYSISNLVQKRGSLGERSMTKVSDL